MSHILVEHIDSLRPIIYIAHYDYKAVCDMISEAISPGCKTFEYSPAFGRVDFENKSPLEKCTLAEFLDSATLMGFKYNTYIILRDVHANLSSPEIYDRLKRIAHLTMHTEGYYATTFIISSETVLPKELEHLITLYPLDYPDQNEIEQRIITEYAEPLEFEISQSDVGEVALNLRGLSHFQVKQVLDQSYCRGGSISKTDIEYIFEEKKQMVLKSGLLEIVAHGEKIQDVGGLPELKKWIQRKSLVFKKLDKALKAGVSMPKGVLILGLPGCGKSLTAKATASAFGVPLARLDVGRLLGKYVGESEGKMRKAFKLAEAISPCVLWIDEIEKAFATSTGGASHEVTTRLMGLFLTWMQEKQSTVFCVATSNNIEGIPPEFLRKGRFDEMFSVELPGDEERMQIIRIHLEKRGHYRRDMPIHKLVPKTKEFSGADIEAGINEAVETMFIEGRDQLNITDLENSFADVIPISKSLADKLKKLNDAIQKYQIRKAS